MSKNPEIQALFDKLCAEKEAIQAKAKPHRDKREAVLAKIRELDSEETQHIAKFKEIEAPLVDLCAQISALAAALGAKRLSQGGQ